MDLHSAQQKVDERINQARQELLQVDVGERIRCWLSTRPRCEVISIDPRELEITVEIKATSKVLGVSKGQTLTFVPELEVPGRWISKERVTPPGGFSDQWMLVITTSFTSYGPPEHA